jgi:nucleotide-binding universal stress UspA family protein
MFDHILLAVDGSDHSLKAAKVAGNLARLSGGTLHVITAYDELPGYLGEPNLSKAIAERTQSAEKILAAALEEVGDISGECESEYLEGSPAETILRDAKTHNADLIIMGTRGRGEMRSLLLGSQSHKVLSEANCPVMLVR